ncbi:hypothetical protein [Rubellicoccus peritrichatus]|uniref:Aminomethyltransferase folate-binding domain-containing protein n=1 Tax=Rubellicoccus peritrichatus TaxID=3080537 RepID=A0AAQ3QSA2_9BACT|nr:hypothetical protein [Puniceicoccus sp. CR14]WOO40156.1 hypothetical protein RZN69_16160 [Puniceicoccus sp. CR14]
MNHYLISKPAALFKVTGEDAADYLQSQFSNDLRHPGVNNPVTYGLWLDQKGKVQGDSFILQNDEESFLLLSYFCEKEALLATVENNIIADEVEIEDLTESASIISLWGEGIAESLPASGEFKVNGSAYCFNGRRSVMSGEILSLASTPENEQSVIEELTLKNPDAWMQASQKQADAERIRSGIPAIPQDIGPSDLPQEAGLEKDAVSFNKGCYLGQEVMARLHAMGRAQRALYRVILPESVKSLPLPVFSGEKKAGELRSANEHNGLALLKRRIVEAKEPLHLGEPNGKPLEIK